ncbi:acyl-CoA-binding domain-containing protein 6-like [Tropilaelaps mercedesae]|uniref:Acyl-CoA-binding domain-containing protein 6 n=1 Tax=Tropilaelaps mercedesae TaxID=418985 RepID=A0A1V9X4T0_9ACAR|nr:acyl-CoA-binding domain-containing protein 6-like [Tropilaelaps mercedesae]
MSPLADDSRRVLEERGGRVGPPPNDISRDMEDDDIVLSDLEVNFNRAASHVVSLASKLDSADLLELYARYKQATEGPCNTDRPSGWFDVKGRQKWDAWKALGDKKKESAMKEYVYAVEKLDPKFDKIPQRGEKESNIGGVSFGISVSTLLNQEAGIEDGMKTVFDWAKEGNVDEVTKSLLPPVKALPTDEDGLTPLHWACDRGHLLLVEALLQRFSNEINVKDASQQTPLHYACSCGHSEVVALLIANGADPILKDEDGVDCVEDVENILKTLKEASS